MQHISMSKSFGRFVLIMCVLFFQGSFMSMPRGTSLSNIQQYQSQSALPPIPSNRPLEKFQPRFMSPQHLPNNGGLSSLPPPDNRMVKSESWTGISLSHTVRY